MSSAKWRPSCLGLNVLPASEIWRGKDKPGIITHTIDLIPQEYSRSSFRRFTPPVAINAKSSYPVTQEEWLTVYYFKTNSILIARGMVNARGYLEANTASTNHLL